MFGDLVLTVSSDDDFDFDATAVDRRSIDIDPQVQRLQPPLP